MVWHSLAQMKGLTDLRVEIRIPPGSQLALPLWTEAEVSLLQALKAIRVAGSFQLTLPFPSVATHSELDELPCRIQRTGQSYM